MVRRIQALIRGYLGRRCALHEVERQLDAYAEKIQALFHGFKARQRVR